MNKNYIYIGGGAVIAVAILIAAWYLFFAGTRVTDVLGNNQPFNQADNRTPVTAGSTDQPTNQETPITSGTDTNQKIFKISNGPVAGATLLESSRPTTTIARFVMADSGHIFDLVLDSRGAIQRPVSNTTIPGINKVLWSERGRGALLQYIDSGVVKTAHFALPAPATTTTATARVSVQFLQNNIASVAVSPDGASVGYLIRTTAGADGYTGRADGSSVKKLFSLPLSQFSLSWPTASTLLAVQAPAAGVVGAAFGVDAKSGGVTPVLFAEGLSALADRAFSQLVYQTAGASRGTYALDTKTGLSKALSFDPLPEQCLFGQLHTTVMYCAAPLQYVDPNYIDQRHQGTVSVQDGIFGYNLATGRAQLLALPGQDGGEISDIAELTVSANESYALFVRTGDRSLWAVRLTQ